MNASFSLSNNIDCWFRKNQMSEKWYSKTEKSNFANVKNDHEIEFHKKFENSFLAKFEIRHVELPILSPDFLNMLDCLFGKISCPGEFIEKLFASTVVGVASERLPSVGPLDILDRVGHKP